MNAIKLRAVFNRRKNATPEHAAKVEIEISIPGSNRKWILTDIELYSNQWEDGLIVRHAFAKHSTKN